MEDATSIAIAQYEQAVHLYQHEDNLTWRKMQQALYVNGAIATVIGADLVQENRWLVALGAALLSVLFLISIEGSRRYMFARLEAVRRGERALCKRADVEPLIVDVVPPRRVPATKFAIRVFMWTMILVWVALAVFWVVPG
ncbi:MAG: hypothetical protein RIE77_01035 [Phycisphaerales bacterium]|jgi:hypothetical protein